MHTKILAFTALSALMLSPAMAATPMLSSSTGIVIEWENSAYNVGINNIAYSLAPVPEPETYGLLLAGLGVLAGVARRRRAG